MISKRYTFYDTFMIHDTLLIHMTRVIEIGSRGRIIVYFENQEIKISNSTSCHLIIDNKMVAPGETV